MDRKLEQWEYGYRATPIEYPISDNMRSATYDQFMTLRDTMVYSNKFYWNNPWRSLIVWMKLDGNPTNTIEIREPNIFMQSFEPTGVIEWDPLGKYISSWAHAGLNPISCEIQMDGRYVLQHKEQFNSIPSSITRINSFIVQHTWSEEIRRAVFDWEWDTPWEIIRLTSFGYVECNLKKWDWLERKMLDQDLDPISLTELQPNSNWWMVEYKDLSYK